MKVIEPIVFQPSQLLSSTATDSNPVYSNATTYGVGDIVSYNTRVYESLEGSNLNNQPDTSPTKWLDIGPMNQYAMFDDMVSTQTIGDDELIVEVKPGTLINSLAFFNLSGNSLNIKVQDGIGGTEVFNETVDLDGSIIIDWYTYFFQPFDSLDTVVKLDIPPYSDCVITITLTGATETRIGAMVYGNSKDLGLTRYGINFGIRDFSIKETDEFGTSTFVQRAYSNRMEPVVFVENTKLRYVDKVLKSLRAKPTVWVGSTEEGYEPLIIYGFYRDYNTDISYPSHSLLSLSIEGLT